MTKRALTTMLLAMSVCAATSSSARAEPESAAVGPAGEVPTGKRVTMYALAGLGLAAYGFAGISLGLQGSAASDHEAFPTKNGFKDCVTIAQCHDLDSAREREELWGTVAATSFLVGSAALLSLVAVELFWPHEPTLRASVGPFVTQSGGGLSLGSRF